jgi:hypothetical protein
MLWLRNVFHSNSLIQNLERENACHHPPTILRLRVPIFLIDNMKAIPRIPNMTASEIVRGILKDSDIIILNPTNKSNAIRAGFK